MLHARRSARSLADSSGRGVSFCSTRTLWTGSLLQRFRIKIGRSLAVESSRRWDVFSNQGWRRPQVMAKLYSKRIYMYLAARFLMHSGEFCAVRETAGGRSAPKTLQSRSSERVRPLVPSAKWVPSEGK